MKNARGKALRDGAVSIQGPDRGKGYVPGTVRHSENQRINHVLIWSRCNAWFTQLPRAKPVACHCCQAIGAIFYSLMLLTVLSLICCTADSYAAADMWEGEYIANLA